MQFVIKVCRLEILPVRSALDKCTTYNVTFLEQKAYGSWVSTQTRMDQLCLLVAFLNSMCPSQDQGLGTDSASPSSPGPSLAVLGFHESHPRLEFTLSFPLEAYLDDLQRSKYSSIWLRRVERHALEMGEPADDSLFIAGLFKFNSTRVMRTFARMRFSPGAIEGEKYTVSSSFFWAS